MRMPAESLSGSSVRDKVVTAAEAVRLIHDGDWVVVEGFVGQCFAEELTLALEQRFLLTGAPRDLGLVFTVASGNRQGRWSTSASTPPTPGGRTFSRRCSGARWPRPNAPVPCW